MTVLDFYTLVESYFSDTSKTCLFLFFVFNLKKLKTKIFFFKTQTCGPILTNNKKLTDVLYGCKFKYIEHKQINLIAAVRFSLFVINPKTQKQ